MADEDDLAAVYKKITHGFVPDSPNPTDVPDPDFDEMQSGLGDWWRDHENITPITLFCNIGGCGEKVGEVRSDGDTAVALLFRTLGKTVVRQPVLRTEQELGVNPSSVRDAEGKTLAAVQEERRRQFNALVLRPVSDGYLTKRTPHRGHLWPLNVPGIVATCPAHGSRAVRENLQDELTNLLKRPRLSKAQRRVAAF